MIVNVVDICGIVDPVHEDSHFPFPGESKKTHGKVTWWSLFLYFLFRNCHNYNYDNNFGLLWSILLLFFCLHIVAMEKDISCWGLYIFSLHLLIKNYSPLFRRKMIREVILCCTIYIYISKFPPGILWTLNICDKIVLWELQTVDKSFPCIFHIKRQFFKALFRSQFKSDFYNIVFFINKSRYVCSSW